MSPKNKPRLSTALLLAAALLLGESGATLGQVPPDKAALDAAIRDYILSHPEVIRESLAKAEQAEQVEHTKKVLRSERKAIYDSGSPTIGPADAKVSIVEFMDYNCPYCRKIHPLLLAYLKQHPDTRIIVKDIATFGKDSVGVAHVVLAAAKQGKFLELHEKLMSHKGTATEAVALEIAGKLGLDVGKLKADAASKEIGYQLMQTQDLANTLNVGGTPLFLIGHNGIPGAPEDLAEQLAKYADEVRRSGCDVC